MFKTILHIILFIAILTKVQAQEPFFAQPFSSSQYLSPAAVGGGIYNQRINGNFRTHFIDNNNTYQTIFAGTDWNATPQWIDGTNYLGIGINVLSDQIMGGAIYTNHLTVNAAYHLYLDDNYDNNISLGLGATYTNRNVDRTKLAFQDQYDPTANLISSSTTELLKNNASSFTMNVGMLFNRHTNTSFLETGASVFFQTLPDMLSTTTSPSLSAKSVLFMNYEKGFNELFSVSFHTSLINKNTVNQILTGGSIGLPIAYREIKDKRLYLGCYYRLGDAIIPNIKLLLSQHTFGVSYDIYNNQATQALLRPNSFELTFHTSFGNMRNTKFRSIYN